MPCLKPLYLLAFLYVREFRELFYKSKIKCVCNTRIYPIYTSIEKNCPFFPGCPGWQFTLWIYERISRFARPIRGVLFGPALLPLPGPGSRLASRVLFTVPDPSQGFPWLASCFPVPSNCIAWYTLQRAKKGILPLALSFWI